MKKEKETKEKVSLNDDEAIHYLSLNKKDREQYLIENKLVVYEDEQGNSFVDMSYELARMFESMMEDGEEMSDAFNRILSDCLSKLEKEGVEYATKETGSTEENN